MYIHLGQDVVVNKKNIIGIFDIENTSISKFTKEFLSESSKKHRVVTVSYELPKSFVVCKEKDETVVYISQISPVTLLKRSKMPINL
ncbi:MAG: DUF370 domain-containing protein [Oscillospiraceae bacterium]|nr:DUF370 domain-containing protein [Oscillospiraceae bacterium]